MIIDKYGRGSGYITICKCDCGCGRLFLRRWSEVRDKIKHFYKIDCLNKRIKVYCEYCRKAKEIRLSEYNNSGKHFCNTEHYRLWQLGKYRGRPAKRTSCGESGDKIGFVFDGETFEMIGNTNGIKYVDII